MLRCYLKFSGCLGGLLSFDFIFSSAVLTFLLGTVTILEALDQLKQLVSFGHMLYPSSDILVDTNIYYVCQSSASKANLLACSRDCATETIILRLLMRNQKRKNMSSNSFLSCTEEGLDGNATSCLHPSCLTDFTSKTFQTYVHSPCRHHQP